MKGKHSKREEKRKKFKFSYLLLIFLVAVVIFGYKYFNIYQENNKPEQEKEIIPISNVKDEITIENEKLVLKSNFEESREKKIIYTFEDNVLIEVRVLEIYINEDEYSAQKERNSQKTGIEIIETDDNELKIYYKRLKLGTDEGLSYQEIYDKYMGIIGAYEVLENEN